MAPIGLWEKKKEERRPSFFFLLSSFFFWKEDILFKRRPSFFFLLSSFEKKTFFLLSSFFFLLSSFGMCGQPGPRSGMWAHGVMYGCLERVRQCAIAFVMVCQCFRVPICFREPAEGNPRFPIGFIRPSRLLAFFEISRAMKHCPRHSFQCFWVSGFFQISFLKRKECILFKRRPSFKKKVFF